MSLNKALGICIGASSIKMAELIEDNGRIVTGKTWYRRYEKSLIQTYENILSEINQQDYVYTAITGRKFKDKINAAALAEVVATEYALKYLADHQGLNQPFQALASLGAENFLVYHIDQNYNIQKIETESKCASGTGDFFLQQIDRINLELDEAITLALDSPAFNISGRCSVYCKSDCTHALNEGIPKGNVVAGLCRMMADKILFLLDKTGKKNIIAVGGVTRNKAVVNYLNDEIEQLYIPGQAVVFEALGAAYYALQHKLKVNLVRDKEQIKAQNSFNHLHPLDQGKQFVTFENLPAAADKAGQECILGLDVGSTTTKAVLIDKNDCGVLARIYLRTEGDPLQAAKRCYQAIKEQLSSKQVHIKGIGVTGSGRAIVGLQAGTSGIVNEIIAHAAGAAYFDANVDTIFEIGGQDAKYIYLENGVPIDYAMNEACSAGTGSFLEEAVKNNFLIDYKKIESIAFQAQKPLSFNDQCSAFIHSDIKTAIQENNSPPDIIAGLVYSICLNYLNKVKSQRKTGQKIFMQGGVCYNRAVPLTMAILLNKEVIVPPDPGLIGAFGVALEIRKKIALGLLVEKEYDLQTLVNTEIKYGQSFICRDSSQCDRKCQIKLLIVNGQKLPFGGACNKYYNQVHHLKYEPGQKNYVQKRTHLLFDDYFKNKKSASGSKKRIGLNLTFLNHYLFPLFYHFFDQLGLEVVLPEQVNSQGIAYKNASFCYSFEVAHGYFYDLLERNCHYIFLPRIPELYVDKSVSYKQEHQCTCLVLQSEAYILQSAFSQLIEKDPDLKIIDPEFNFSQGFDSQWSVFLNTGLFLGLKKEKIKTAYQFALNQFNQFRQKRKEIGRQYLEQLADSKDYGIVLFGRPYNAMAQETNLGIPEKIATRGLSIIPWDFLPFEDEKCDENMTWAFGQELLKCAGFVKKHPQLYGLYITNFSCGPDSFILGYFRDIMENKPSLTLEIDSHTADTGINTRIDAFLDILEKQKNMQHHSKPEEVFLPAKIIIKDGHPYFIDSNQNESSLMSRDICLLVPSMGQYASQMLADSFSSVGLNAVALPEYTFSELMLGRENTLGKECLPMILVIGGLLQYLEKNKQPDQKIAYFMPSNPGNCRFAQYSVFINKLIKKKKIKNLALLSLSPENSYGGVPMDGMLSFLKGIIISDVMEDIKNALTVLARDKQEAFIVLDQQWEKIRKVMRTRGAKKLYRVLKEAASHLAQIPLKYPLKKARKVALLGDFFARRDNFSCQNLVETLAAKDIVVKREHVSGFFNYVDFLIDKKVLQSDFNFKEKIEFIVKQILQRNYEKKIKKILSGSGLYEYELMNIKKVLQYGQKFFSLKFTGEQMLIVGHYFKDILKSSHGAISIGPFACMPIKVSEAILTKESTLDKKNALEEKVKYDFNLHHLPFLSIESDGNLFPQIVDAKVENFCHQVQRVFREMEK